MGNLKERSFWPADIYLIDYADPPMGGEWGISNVAHTQLACRTFWLLEFLLRTHNAEGRHALRDADVSREAKIPESKLALDVPTATLRASLDSTLKALSRLEALVGNTLNEYGTGILALYKALLVYWQVGCTRISFDLFSKEFTFYGYEGTGIIDGVAGDDSLDVADTSNLRPGEQILLIGSTGAADEEVIIKKVLTDNRLVLTSELQVHRQDGVIAKTNWHLDGENTTAKKGAVYLTSSLDTLEGAISGEFTICHMPGNQFRVFYRTDYASDWNQASIIETIQIWEQQYTSFMVPGGTWQFRIVADTDSRLDHLALKASRLDSRNGLLRTPRAEGRFFALRYGALYGIPMQDAEIVISEQPYFGADGDVVITIGSLSMPDPMCDLSAAVMESFSPTVGKTYYWRIRYQSSENDWSAWSNTASFTEV